MRANAYIGPNCTILYYSTTKVSIDLYSALWYEIETFLIRDVLIQAN